MQPEEFASFVTVSATPHFGAVDDVIRKLRATFPRKDGFRPRRHIFDDSSEEIRAKGASIGALPSLLGRVKEDPGRAHFWTTCTASGVHIWIAFSRQEPVMRLAVRLRGGGDITAILERLADNDGWLLREADPAEFERLTGTREIMHPE
jgi:hypothetical protein